MKSLYRIGTQVSYFLGVLSLILAILVRFLPGLGLGSHFQPHGALIFAGVLFLCALASFAMTRLETS